MFSSSSRANIRRRLARHATNARGFSTRKKLVVFESDDWGSIRMPSVEVYAKLRDLDATIAKNPYCRYDTLASTADLTALFEVLSSFQDHNGNHPVFTANTVVANPDFELIKKDHFRSYHYEAFTKTLKRYSDRSNAFSIWKEGMQAGVFFPQFHGREHVNVEFWLQELQKGVPFVQKAFEYGCWIFNYKVDGKFNIQAAFDTGTIESLESHKTIISEGLDLFEQIFHYRSNSFIANNFIFHKSLLPALRREGVSVIQGMKYSPQPLLSNAKREMIRQYTGKKSQHDQVHLVRNCVFEPSQQVEHYDSVKACLSDIENAFLWKRPAIITTHRLNYIGSLDEENRTRNLRNLRQLLQAIVAKWPEVEFLHSSDLGELIRKADGKHE